VAAAVPGRTGWYVARLWAGDRARFTDLETR
jgi:hypothetical protein